MENHISSQTCRWKSGGRADLSEKDIPNVDIKSQGYSVLSTERWNTREIDQGLGLEDTPGLRAKMGLN